MLLEPGFNLTLRPMKYPQFYEMYRDAIKNTWTVEEVDLNSDLSDLRSKLSPSERHLINRLVAFFATGDNIVGNNLVLNYYKHINSPEARMYLSRQIYEEALHVQFYLTLLDTYLPDDKERAAAFAAIENIPSIKLKGDFCFKWIDKIKDIDVLVTKDDRREFIKNMMCFASCVEGLFFFGSFAYVYYLRSKGLLHGLGAGTNWVFRDETCHIDAAYEVVKIAFEEEPDLFDSHLKNAYREMIADAIDCELKFAEDTLQFGVGGLSQRDMKTYLQFVADQRMTALGIAPVYRKKNPFPFMELQDVQELTNFFERRVSAYQMGVSGNVSFDDEDF